MSNVYRIYCPFCNKKKARGYDVIGWNRNARPTYCPGCNEYSIDIYGSSVGIEGESTGYSSYYEITEEQFHKYKGGDIKVTEIEKETGKYLKSSTYDYD